MPADRFATNRMSTAGCIRGQIACVAEACARAAIARTRREGIRCPAATRAERGGLWCPLMKLLFPAGVQARENPVTLEDYTVFVGKWCPGED